MQQSAGNFRLAVPHWGHIYTCTQVSTGISTFSTKPHTGQVIIADVLILDSIFSLPHLDFVRYLLEANAHLAQPFASHLAAVGVDDFGAIEGRQFRQRLGGKNVARVAHHAVVEQVHGGSVAFAQEGIFLFTGWQGLAGFGEEYVPGKIGKGDFGTNLAKLVKESWTEFTIAEAAA